MTERAKRKRESNQDKMFVLEVLRGMVRAGLVSWRTRPSCERELQLLTGEIFLMSEAGITRVR